MEAIARAEPAFVSDTEMSSEMKLYERINNTDRAGFEKNIRSAIDKMKKNSILSQLRGNEDRYEISATLKLLITPEEVEAFSRQYKKLRDDGLSESSNDSGETVDE